jgi:hypothetical protein
MGKARLHVANGSGHCPIADQATLQLGGQRSVERLAVRRVQSPCGGVNGKLLIV